MDNEIKPITEDSKGQKGQTGHLRSITDKLFSGRWISTVVISLVFAICAYNKILSPEQIMSVVMLVISFYFSKPK